MVLWGADCGPWVACVCSVGVGGVVAAPAWFLVVDVGPMPLVTLVQGCWCFPREPLLWLLQGWCVSREGSLHLGVGEGALETSCTPQH